MKAKLPKLAIERPKLLKRFALGSAASALIGLVLWAGFDVQSRSASERLDRDDRLRALGRVTNALFLANEAQVDDLMARLRIELRAQGLWTEPAIVDVSASNDADRSAIDGRRLHSVLRRALKSREDITAFELVVAGHDGLSSVRFERTTGIEAREMPDPREREGIAKSLWYADAVRRSVVSAGRRVERGDLVFETVGDIEHPIVRLAIALHEPGELIQGALVASIDLSGAAEELEALAAVPFRLKMVTPDGRGLASSSTAAKPDSRIASLAARITGRSELPEVFLADGQLVYGVPMAHADGSRANRLAIIEIEAPPTGLSAWATTPWPICLLAIGWVSGLAGWSVLRFRSPLPLEPAGSRSDRGDESGADTASAMDRAPVEIARESFVLRDWLADVRSCLERDAATRGMALDLRCERSLPVELESDPAWLGGLLVAMGRDALDTTASGRIVVDVVEDVGDTLRFEIEASGVELQPACGMEEVAQKIGGRFEAGREGRVALVLQSALAGS